MPDLLQTQHAFAATLQGPAASSDLVPLLVGDPAEAARRLDLYRGNVLAARTKALGLAYPVSAEVVGEEFFDALARRFGRAYPSRSGDLAEYGAEFPGFIESFEPARAVPYLADLARLEWGVHLARGAADEHVLSAAEFASVSTSDPSALRIRLVAGTTLLESPHPIASIWSQHQSANPDFDGIDLGQSECVLVGRAATRVTVTVLTPAAFALLAALRDGASLGRAAAAALAADSACDLASLVSATLLGGAVSALMA